MFWRNVKFLVPVVLAVSGVPMVSATACEARYALVTSYELRTVSDTRWVTAYDEEGCAYRVKKVVTRIVKVPVTRLVRSY